MDEQKHAFRKANVTSVAAAHTLHDVYSSFFAPLLPLLTEKLGFTYAMAGLLSMVQKLPSLLNPLIGILADRIVVRSAIVAAPVVTIFAMSLLGLAPSVALLGVLLFTCGISGAVFHVTAPVLMRQVSGNQIGRGMSYFMFGGEISRTIGPLLITAAVSWWGLEGTWRLIPFGLVASLLLFFNLRTIDKSHLKKFQKKSQTPLSKSLREIAPFFVLVAPIILFRGFGKSA
ncbi:MAG: MFS transporter, partial [Verrucomicrobiota bacterium]|nr:MFS transporter [Verrucomicrobiota bacterium]